MSSRNIRGSALALLSIVLLGLGLAIGLYPQPLLATIEDVIRGLTFVRPV